VFTATHSAGVFWLSVLHNLFWSYYTNTGTMLFVLILMLAIAFSFHTSAFLVGLTTEINKLKPAISNRLCIYLLDAVKDFQFF
jgi:hypothetical protein